MPGHQLGQFAEAGHRLVGGGVEFPGLHAQAFFHDLDAGEDALGDLVEAVGLLFQRGGDAAGLFGQAHGGVGEVGILAGEQGVERLDPAVEFAGHLFGAFGGLARGGRDQLALDADGADHFVDAGIGGGDGAAQPVGGLLQMKADFLGARRDALGGAVQGLQLTGHGDGEVAGAGGGVLGGLDQGAGGVAHLDHALDGAFGAAGQGVDFGLQAVDDALAVAAEALGQLFQGLGMAAQQGADLFGFCHGLVGGGGQVGRLPTQRRGDAGQARLGILGRIDQLVEMAAQMGRLHAQDRAAVEEGDDQPHDGERQDRGAGDAAELGRLQFEQVAPAHRLVDIGEADGEPGDRNQAGDAVDDADAPADGADAALFHPGLERRLGREAAHWLRTRGHIRLLLRLDGGQRFVCHNFPVP